MQHKNLNEETVEHFLERISSIQEDSTRRWGRMTSAQMLAHVRLLMEVSLGEQPFVGKGQIPFKWLKPVVLSGILPFPRGKLKAPVVVLDDGADSVEEEIRDIKAVIRRFLALCVEDPDRCPMNPVFGSMSMAQWSRLHGLHLNHHLAQFSV